jgi:predicted RND superfamily exporter protein
MTFQKRKKMTSFTKNFNFSIFFHFENAFIIFSSFSMCFIIFSDTSTFYFQKDSFKKIYNYLLSNLTQGYDNWVIVFAKSDIIFKFCFVREPHRETKSFLFNNW